jgi:hypothetical protein
MPHLVTFHRRQPKEILSAESGTTILVPLGDGRVRVLRANEAMTRSEARSIRTTTYHLITETGPSGAVEVPARVDLAIGALEDGAAVVHVRYSSTVADIAGLVRSWRPGEDAAGPVEAAVTSHVAKTCGRFERPATYAVEGRIRDSRFAFRGLEVVIDTCTIELTSESADRVFEVERIHRERTIAQERATIDKAQARAQAEIEEVKAEAEARAAVLDRGHTQALTRMDDDERIERQNRAQRLIPGFADLDILVQLRLLDTDLSAESITAVMQEIRQEEQDTFDRQMTFFATAAQLKVLDKANIDAIASRFGAVAAVSPAEPRSIGAPTLAKEPDGDGDKVQVDGEVFDVHPGEPTDEDGAAPSLDDQVDAELAQADDATRPPAEDDGGGDEEQPSLSLMADDL